LPGARARVRSGNSLGLRGSAGGGLSIALTGPNYPDIAAAADAFAQELAEVPGLSGIRVQYQATQPQLSIGVDRQRASDLRVPMSTLSTTLRALIDEDEIGELTIDDEAVPIILQSAMGAVRDPGDLTNLYVRSEAGALVPLSQIVDLFRARRCRRAGPSRPAPRDRNRCLRLGRGDPARGDRRRCARSRKIACPRGSG
jgi:HAE1 family hydrophobic/amphiphilic exporter-1